MPTKTPTPQSQRTRKVAKLPEEWGDGVQWGDSVGGPRGELVREVEK